MIPNKDFLLIELLLTMDIPRGRIEVQRRPV